MKSKIAALMLLAGLAACDYGTEPGTAARRQSELQIGGTRSPLNDVVQTMYNGLVTLANLGEVESRTASRLATPLAEIKGAVSVNGVVDASSALSKMQSFINDVNRAYPADMSQCAHTNLIRAAQHVVSAITYASANAGAVRAEDMTLPWGVCPFPLPVQNLTASLNGTTATVMYSYGVNGNYFWIYQVMPDGSLSLLKGGIDSNDGVPGGDMAPTDGVRTFNVTVSSQSSIQILVRVCGGLHCADAQTSLATTAPTTPSILNALNSSAGVTLSWTAVPGATSYTLYRDGVALKTLAGLTYVDATIAVNTTYAYSIEACNSLGCSASRASSTVTTPATPPDVPPTTPPEACHQGGNNKDKEKCKKENENRYGNGNGSSGR